MGAVGELRSRSEAETVSVGRTLAADLPDGAWILLTGPLGAGKTAFVRGLAEGLGIDPRLVHSPTFTLISEYRGRRTLAHVDLYRIEQSREIDELGLDDLRERNLIVAVEWGERLPGGCTAGAITVRIEVGDGEERRITITRE
jgi:tRNA threonylcarbamoyladenosine biosynthesis protein TsaE